PVTMEVGALDGLARYTTPIDVAREDLQTIAEAAVQQLEQGGLAAARFAGDAQDLAVAHLQRHAIDSFHEARRRAVPRDDIVDHDHRAVSGLTRRRSEMAFETRKKPMKIRMIDAMGGRSHHQRPAISAWYLSAQ